MDTSRLDAIQARWEANDYGSDSDAEDVLDLVAEVRRLRDGIRTKVDWVDRTCPQKMAFMVTDDFRDLLGHGRNAEDG